MPDVVIAASEAHIIYPGPTNLTCMSHRIYSGDKVLDSSSCVVDLLPTVVNPCCLIERLRLRVRT